MPAATSDAYVEASPGSPCCGRYTAQRGVERIERAERSLFDFGPLAQQYDRWYETPTGKLHDRVQRDDVQSLLRPAHRGERLLDVGCGTGHWSRIFVELGYMVVGVDISEKMVEVAKMCSASNCIFEVADACALPYDDHCFDVVAAMAMLEFVGDVRLAVEEMVRCVKEKGLVLIGTLNRLASIHRDRLAKGCEPYVSGQMLTPGELYNLLEPFGRIRMVASSPHERPGTRQFRRQIVQGIGEPKSMNGPFIVAVVQR